MPIRILFEIGHKAVRKAKPLDSFTHDWELFVRASDGKEMSKYVEKIVFNLHESFPNPVRTQRDPPYVLREAGYGGFLLPIDIYFKASPRDEPKFLSITYDLDITKPQHVFKYNHTFLNPSTEFRYKLLDGGGLLINTEGHEDRSQSESRSRSQVGNTTASTGGKKHKSSKTEEAKPLSQFENLFGPPIQNLSVKHSPATISTDSHKTQKSSSKDRPSEKISKEKKDKSKSSSSKDANNSKESFSKKSSTDEKNERRDDKRKDKSHGKSRDRSKEKPSKRPISPKSVSRSPKRSTSPASHRTTSSNSSRHEPKLDDKSVASGGKKSKKEKRDKSNDRNRSTASDNKKDNKEIKHQTQAFTKQQKDERSASNKTLEKLNGSGKRDESTGSNTPKDSTSRDKISNPYRPAFDATKPPSPIDLPPQTKPQTPSDLKKSDKHDKDGTERKHKHKKEKKSKDKDKDKERKKDKDKSSKSKELAGESLNVSNPRTSTPTQHSNRISSTKPNSTPQPIQGRPPSQRSSHLSDKSSSDYDMEDDYMARSTSPPPSAPPAPAPPKSDINDTNTSMDHAMAEAPRSIQSDSPKKHAAEKISSNKREKEPKSTQSTTPIKEDKKRKRKSKVDKLKPEPDVNSGTTVSGGGKRKVQSPLVNDEPSSKYSKKDDERSPMPIKKDTIKKESMKLERISPAITPNNKLAPISTPSSSSSDSIASISENQPKSESPSSNDNTYIAQLKALQHKIMTLQDNDELQQVVDMIAATGCYEMTGSTFDFDLCALDRTTVQRLQERLG